MIWTLPSLAFFLLIVVVVVAVFSVGSVSLWFLLSRTLFLFVHCAGCACRENAAATSNSVRVNNYSTRYVDAITVIIRSE